MASQPLTPIISGYDVPTSYAVAYTVPDNVSRIGIDAVVFNNYSANNAHFSVRLVQVGSGDVLDEISQS